MKGHSTYLINKLFLLPIISAILLQSDVNSTCSSFSWISVCIVYVFPYQHSREYLCRVFYIFIMLCIDKSTEYDRLFLYLYATLLIYANHGFISILYESVPVNK